MKEIDEIPDKESLDLYCTECNLKVFENREFDLIYVEDVEKVRCFQMPMEEFVRWAKLGRKVVNVFEKHQKECGR